MEIAIVGCGHIAAPYAAGLRAYPELSLVAAADLDIDRAEALAAPFGASAHDNVDALLESSDAELVVNLTLHEAHAQVTRACLEVGRHVLSEKPLALDRSAAEALVDIADAKGLALGCAPISPWADAQQYAARLLREGHIGDVRMVDATGNFGRVTEWNPNPEPFLRVGPLYDGAVYHLSVLTAIFGPVARVRCADAAQLLTEHEHDGQTFRVETPDHVAATLEFAHGPLAQLTASMYVPHRTREFASLEVHGDAGSLYLPDCGNVDGRTDEPSLQVARLGRPYRPLPLPRAPTALAYASAIADVAQAARDDREPLASGRQAAHVVAALAAIEACAETGEPMDVPDLGFSAPELLPWTGTRERHRTRHPLTRGNDEIYAAAARHGATHEEPTRGIALPPVGFGCSRYRGGTTYVDLRATMGDALAAGVRLFDTAELYGTEAQLGAWLNGELGPPRERLVVVGKAWNTNHRPEHLRAAATASLARLGIETFDVYMLHWPEAWQHQGPLGDLSRLSHEEAQPLTFPSDANGEILIDDGATLAETWGAMEGLVEEGLTAALGICNVDQAQLAEVIDIAEIPPAVIQIECHPYLPQRELVQFAHEQSIRVMAHSPLSAPGLLNDETLRTIAGRHAVSTAQVVLRWLLQRGLVPIPSSTRPDHVHANADLFGFALSEPEMREIDALERPQFSR
ncbi:MAG: aldo/keto reductase [Candidatus Bipolaricaulia bacterium]